MMELSEKLNTPNVSCNLIKSPLKSNRMQFKKVLVYHASNTKKGFPIKGTNLRVSFEYI